ncbi:PI-PLC X domain-containing protein 1 isoform X2 [Tachysurus vachellii]|uniref:PI-PLC X domain-containing protein 1 isoform X2 n=1 Tax=Tachysurus vachellii TaxID=175792 RepID=UPI00296AA418|nr:PI-PLC X domain-containing protein 1 isoform X2 [Tachysurus vachellii]
MSDVWRSQPCSRCADWMSQLPSELLDVPLWNLTIPGSHDTMTYCLDRNSPVLSSEPWILTVLDHVVPCVIRPCIKKWATTQELSICSQLDSGIRFLDLRIAHKKKDLSWMFYFAHGIYSLLTVKEALTDVADWLVCHTNEVVIISLSAFEDVTPVQHNNLINFLIELFGKKLCPKSVILSYADPSGSEFEELWPAWDYWWANESDPNLVISYLEHKKDTGRPDGFFMAGLNLTEDTRYVLCHLTQSMKSMTLQAYTVLMDWVKKQHPGSLKTSINIICADFVGISRNEFCEVVIGLNTKH